jgi:hypothetical protein
VGGKYMKNVEMCKFCSVWSHCSCKTQIFTLGKHNCLMISFSVATQSVFVHLSGQRPPLIYHLCAGYDAAVASGKPLVKVNWTVLLLILFTFIAPMALKIQVMILERSWHRLHPQTVPPLFLNGQNISDIRSDLINMAVYSCTLMISLAINRTSFSDFSKYSHYYHIIHLFTLLFAPSVVLFTLILYYVRHPPLRRFLIREIKEYLGLHRYEVYPLNLH